MSWWAVLLIAVALGLAFAVGMVAGISKILRYLLAEGYVVVVDDDKPLGRGRLTVASCQDRPIMGIGGSDGYIYIIYGDNNAGMPHQLVEAG